jgi:acetyltransferase-like isoleucine patch superfamily enzyme
MAFLEMIQISMYFKKALNLMGAISHYVWWRWRFHSFGWRSRLSQCDMLTNPKAISIGKKVSIRKGARLEAIGKNCDKAKLIIGDGTSIQFYFHCGAAESVIIGKDVLIAGRVYITDHDHAVDDSEPAVHCSKLNTAPVIIEDGAWLGEGCVILKGVRIGTRAVVGANAVVTKNVPPFCVVAGVPAKLIRRLNVSYDHNQDSFESKRMPQENLAEVRK